MPINTKRKTLKQAIRAEMPLSYALYILNRPLKHPTRLEIASLITITVLFLLNVGQGIISLHHLNRKYTIQSQLTDMKRSAIVEKRQQPKSVLYPAITTTTKSKPLAIQAIVYGYNSLPNQTDGTPFITASQQRTRDGIVANNCLPFGTKVIIDDKTYEVQDRMNKRYGCNIYDIWFPEYRQAIDWGKRHKQVIIIE